MCSTRECFATWIRLYDALRYFNPHFLWWINPPFSLSPEKTLVFKNTFMANKHKSHFLEIICERANNIGDQWFSEVLKGIPLKHTPKPLPTGCKGLPFIKGFGGCVTGVMWYLSLRLETNLGSKPTLFLLVDMHTAPRCAVSWKHMFVFFWEATSPLSAVVLSYVIESHVDRITTLHLSIYMQYFKYIYIYITCIYIYILYMSQVDTN